MIEKNLRTYFLNFFSFLFSQAINKSDKELNCLREDVHFSKFVLCKMQLVNGGLLSLAAESGMNSSLICYTFWLITKNLKVFVNRLSQNEKKEFEIWARAKAFIKTMSIKFLLGVDDMPQLFPKMLSPMVRTRLV